MYVYSLASQKNKRFTLMAWTRWKRPSGPVSRRWIRRLWCSDLNTEKCNTKTRNAFRQNSKHIKKIYNHNPQNKSLSLSIMLCMCQTLLLHTWVVLLACSDFLKNLVTVSASEHWELPHHPVAVVVETYFNIQTTAKRLVLTSDILLIIRLKDIM